MWVYCPRHECVPVNERGNNVTSKTPSTETLTTGRADRLRTIRDKLTMSEMATEETTSLRLLELGVGGGDRLTMKRVADSQASKDRSYNQSTCNMNNQYPHQSASVRSD